MYWSHHFGRISQLDWERRSLGTPFPKVLVEPTNVEQTLQILKNIKDRYEAHHHVTYLDDAITACVKLTDRYVTDRFFPDKAIDAMDEVGARVHLQNAEVPAEVIEIQKKLEEADAKKKLAVKNQNFELAASFQTNKANWKPNSRKCKKNGNEAKAATVSK